MLKKLIIILLETTSNTLTTKNIEYFKNKCAEYDKYIKYLMLELLLISVSEFLEEHMIMHTENMIRTSNEPRISLLLLTTL